MRNLHKLLIVLISVALFSTGVMAQADAPLKMEQRVKPVLPEQTTQVISTTENAPTDAELVYKTDLGYWTVPMKNSNSVLNTMLSEYKMAGDELASIELMENAKNPTNYKPITLNIDGAIAYAFVAYDPSAANPIGPASFDVSTPGTISSLGSNTANDFIAGGSWADDVWYGVEYGTSQLYSMDISSGVMTAIGTPSNAGFNGMAYDPSTSTMFAATGDVLYTVDLSTGAATMVGTIQTAGNLIIGLACSAGGELYGTDIVSDVLYSIDPATGAGTIVGPLGINISYAQSLEYDNENDILYAGAYTTQGELYTIDPGTGAATLVGAFQGGAEMCALAFPYSPVSYDDDLGIQSIIAPSTGVDLTATEAVTVRIKNYGVNAQSNFDVWFTLDGGTPVTESISATLNSGETMDHTFAVTVDLSAYGTYEFEACVVLSGDENPDNDCKTKMVENLEPSVCFPTYSSGCAVGDGITDFAVEQISNLGNGCDNTIATGVSQYLTLGPAILFPGGTHTFTLGTGYSTQHTNIWIDFNDDLIFAADELILYNYIIENANQLYDVDITLPAAAEEGLHMMRVMAVWITEFTDPCGSYSYGESEDYMVNVGVAAYGNLSGTVTANTGGAPIEGAMISVANGQYTTTSGSDGTYEIMDVLTGDWDISCMATGYNPSFSTITITEGNVTVEDFAMLAPTMDIDPIAVDIVIDPESTATETINIANNGDGELMWTADLELLTKSGSKIYGVTGYSKDVIGSEEIANADVIAVGTPMSMEKIKNLNIPLQTTNGKATDEIDIIGGTTNAYNAGPRSRGNAFYCTTDKNLIEFMGWHNVTTNPTQMWMCIYEGDAAEGLYNLVSASDITPAPVGLGWVSSGVINFPLVAGKYYLLIATFEQACGYYAEPGITPWPYPVAFGEAIGGAGYTWAPTSVFPPDPTQTVTAGAWVEPILYHQQLVTGDGGTVWLEIDTDEGTLAAGTNEDMTLSFSSIDIPAGTVKTAEITFFSDPNVGTVTVPVSMTVGNLLFGYIEGNVMLTGDAPYNWEDVENVLVEAGPYSAYPDANGDYQIVAYPGTWDVTATLYGYEMQTEPNIVVTEGGTVTGIDFTMPTIYGMLMGYVTDAETGDPIENVTITVMDTPFELMTDADGYYELFIEAGTYDVMADHPTYDAVLAEDVVVEVEMDTQQDFELEFSCPYCDATTNTEDEYITDVICGDIQNLGTPWQGGIANYTDQSTVIFPGFSEDITVNNGNAWASDIVYVWVDWNMNCEFDQGGNEEFMLENVGGTGQTFTGQITAPVSAVEGIYRMRVRMTYSTPPVPCGSASYGEIEEYSIFVPPGTYGELEGYVTELGSGDPIEGAIIDVAGLYETTSGSDGYYYFEEIYTGTWDVYCTAPGYNPDMQTVTIVEGDLTEQDFELAAPGFVVDPLIVNVTMEPNSTQDEVVNISNSGLGNISWEASVEFISKSGEKVGGTVISKTVIGSEEAAASDVIAVGKSVPVDQLKNLNIPMQTTPYSYNAKPYPSYYPEATDEIDIIGGTTNAYNAGPRSRGNAFHCTTPALLMEFMGWHNVTSNPTQMWMCVYEGVAAEGVYDLVVAIDISPAPLGLGWVSSGDVNYWLQEDMYYLIIATFQQACGYYAEPGITPWPYPVAFGEAIGGAGYTWAPTSVFPPDQTQTVPAGAWVEPILYYQQLVSSTTDPWLTIDPQAGELEGGENEDMTLHFNTQEMLPGIYEAEIQFSTDPNIGEPVIEVTLTVEGLIPAVNLDAMYSCTDVMLSWEMPTGGDPDSWKIYRNGEEIDDVDVMEYTDMMVDPEVEYTYTVTAVYDGEESQPSTPAMITVPTPDDLEALDIEAMADTPNENDVTITWAEPDACLAPDSYSIYRDNTMIADGVTGLEYVDGALSAGFYEYYVVAVYYFGESGASDPAYVLITGVEDLEAGALQIFPNPASELVNVKSPVSIDRIYVLNNSGQVVIDEEVNSTEYQINVSRYEAGVYFIKLETSEGIMLRKVAVK